MKRFTAFFVIVLMVSLTGCTSGTTPAPDPFFGRVTISPPSTQMNSGRAGYIPSATPSASPRAVVATPVDADRGSSTLDGSWPSPPSPNFQPGSTATSSPNSIASTTEPSRTLPNRPVYLSQSAIEDSVRQPNYDIAPSNPRYGGSSASVAAAGAGRALTSSPSSSRQVYPAPDWGNVKTVNGSPVREQSNISYHSADGSVPQYADPRSSFGRSPRDRFRRSNAGSEAPRWSSGQANTGSEAPRWPSGQANAATPTNPGQPRVTAGTPASSTDLEKLLPPIRGYTNSNRTARAQSDLARSPRAHRTYSRSSYAAAQDTSPGTVINIADILSTKNIATRPSSSSSSSNTHRLSYEAPVSKDDSSDSSSSSTHYDPQVQSTRFTSPVLYGHDKDYNRLRGKLEYSGIDRRWKLRYISVSEEKTDNYGGSVILNDEAKLSGLEHGDFVEVHGRILSGPQSDSGYAPRYEIAEIQRVR